MKRTFTPDWRLERETRMGMVGGGYGCDGAAGDRLALLVLGAAAARRMGAGAGT